MTTVVVGGGMGGALVARALMLRGIETIVVEAADRPGGVAAPIHKDGYLLEPGPSTVLLPHGALGVLVEGLGLTVSEAPHLPRLVFLAGHLTEVAPGPGLLARPLVSVPGRLRALAEMVIPARVTSGDESLASFLVRRFGREAGALGAWLVAAGVYAGDPDRLSARAAFPQLVGLAQGGSVLRGLLRARRGPSAPRARPHLVAGGTGQIGRAVAASLGPAWRNGFRVNSVLQRPGRWVVEGPQVVEADQVVLAVPPEEAGKVLGRTLGGSEAAPVAVVWLGGPGVRLPEAMGVLVGRSEGLSTLGFLFESSYDPGRAPLGHGLVKAIVGGATRPEAVDCTDSELIEMVRSHLEPVIGRSVSPQFSAVVRHLPGIPQYPIGHAAWLADLEASAPSGLHFAGWGYRGVGVAQLARDAVRMADLVASR